MFDCQLVNIQNYPIMELAQLSLKDYEKNLISQLHHYQHELHIRYKKR